MLTCEAFANAFFQQYIHSWRKRPEQSEIKLWSSFKCFNSQETQKTRENKTLNNVHETTKTALLFSK